MLLEGESLHLLFYFISLVKIHPEQTQGTLAVLAPETCKLDLVRKAGAAGPGPAGGP